MLVAAEPMAFVLDFEAACAFYETLGFHVVYRYGNPPYYGQVARDSACLNLRHVDRPVIDPRRRDAEELLTATFMVRHIRALHDAARAAGVPIVRALGVEPWGALAFIVADPSGNLIYFSGSNDA